MSLSARQDLSRYVVWGLLVLLTGVLLIVGLEGQAGIAPDQPGKTVAAHFGAGRKHLPEGIADAVEAGGRSEALRSFVFWSALFCIVADLYLLPKSLALWLVHWLRERIGKRKGPRLWRAHGCWVDQLYGASLVTYRLCRTWPLVLRGRGFMLIVQDINLQTERARGIVKRYALGRVVGDFDLSFLRSKKLYSVSLNLTGEQQIILAMKYAK